MKTIWKTTASLFVLLLMFGLYSCQQDNNVTESIDDGIVGAPEFFSSDEFALEEIDEAEMAYELEEATMDEVMKLTPNGGKDQKPGEGKDRKPRKGLKPGWHLGYVLMKLDLTEDQIMQVREFMTAHRECLKDIFMAEREEMIAEIRAANEKRVRIINAVREGSIEVRDAMKLLRELNFETKKKLMEIHKKYFPQKLRCNCALFANIYQMLIDTGDPEKAEHFKEWVDKFHPYCHKDEEEGDEN